MNKKTGLLLLLFALLFQWACHLPKSSSNQVDFIILQMNDVYEISPLEGGEVGGLARVATLKKELLKENPNTISVLSGDFLSPSLVGMLKDENGKKIAGKQMVETLNALGLDYVTFGNHEFDIKDPDLLQERIDQSDFLFVCSNAFRNQKEGKVAPFTQKGKAIPPYVFREFSNPSGDKIKLGITGVLLPFNKQEYVQYTSVEDALQTAAEEMKSQSDIMVAITHLAIDEDIEMAKKIEDYALFLGGHDHVNMKHKVGSTIITKADANAKTVYIHRFSYNLKTTKLTLRSELRKIDNNLANEPVTQKIVKKWEGKVEGIIENMGYSIDNEIFTAKQPLICTEAKIRSEQTNFGTLSVLACEKVIPGADAYFINSGSMRLDDNLSGVITEYDILRVFPYGGAIVKMELPGDVLNTVLDAGLETNRGEGGFLQNLHISKSSDGKWLVKNQPINPKKKYTVVMPKFLASGKEANLGLLANYTFQSFDDFDGIENDIRDIVIAYMKKKQHD